MGMSRRHFIKSLLFGAAFAAAGCARESPPTPPQPSGGKQPTQAKPTTEDVTVGKFKRVKPEGPDVAVGTGQDAASALKSALDHYGGMEAFVSRGDTVVIKPNLAWARVPEQAANTQPAVLRAVIQACKDAGAGEVLVVEHSCDTAQVAFDLSGAAEVCKDMRVPLISLDKEAMYDTVPVRGGVNIKEEQIATDVLDCDVYINLPICKVHAAAKVTLGLKNQMGAIWRPQRYHEAKSQEEQDENLHQNIADLATALRPTVTIIDCTRVLLTNGPKGPGKVETPGAIIVSPDMVAADAVACRFLKVDPATVGHIRIAANAGVGKLEGLHVAGMPQGA